MINDDYDQDLDDRYYLERIRPKNEDEDPLTDEQVRAALAAHPEAWHDDEMTRLTPREVAQLEAALDAPPSERYFADELNGYFADRQGFHDPKRAAEHAVMIQGGYSTPLREAGRMIKDGGVSAERARAWLAAHGYTENDVER